MSSESVFRGPDTDEIQVMGDNFGRMTQGILQGIGHDKIFRNCSICRNWLDPTPTDPRQGCRLYQCVPPVKIIVCGCDKFVDHNDIPY